MKKITINSCGDCPYFDTDYSQDMSTRFNVCGLSPFTIVDKTKIHPQCELEDE